METKLTPGPWEAVIYDGSFDPPLIKSDHRTIGRLHGMEDRQHEANAKLIAAAPEMLEALQILVGDIERGPRRFTSEEKLTIARNAIKKATE